MRHFFAFLFSAVIHVGIFFGVWTWVSVQPPTPSVPVEAMTFDLGMLVAENTEPRAKPQPTLQPEPTLVPETTLEPEPKPVAIAKPIIKPIVKKPEPKQAEKKPIKQPVVKKTQPKKTIKTSVKKKPAVKKQKPKQKKPKKITKKNSKKPTKQSTAKKSVRSSKKTTSVTAKKATTQAKKKPQQSASSGKPQRQQSNNANAGAYRSGLQAAIDRAASRSYPKQARRMRKQGTVRVKFNLGRDGRISNPNVVSSSGSRLLDKAAIKALKRLGKYKKPPAGFPTTLTVPIQFRLR